VNPNAETLSRLFPESVELGADYTEVQLKTFPAKWVVYVLADANDRPVQLLSVRNLRASLLRRLLDVQRDAPTRKLDYREIVRKVWFRRVDSALEADSVYFEFAHQLFPGRVEELATFARPWFIHVDPAAEFPRYTRTQDLSARSGILIGPIETRAMAGRLIEDVLDGFDLCRYHHILIQAPHATACPYKDMKKCPAPCDGSVSMEQYRALVDLSAQFLTDPSAWIQSQEQRMHEAASELEFELAAKIKDYVDFLKRLQKGPCRFARPLDDFSYVSVQRGGKSGIVKLFLVEPGRLEMVGTVDVKNDDVAEIVHSIVERRRASSTDVDARGALLMGLAWHHLLRSQREDEFIPLREVTADRLRRAIERLKEQREPRIEDEVGGASDREVSVAASDEPKDKLGATDEPSNTSPGTG
jgi:excinuclease ABC subunit C